MRNHHERYDGGGYPDGTAGEDLPLEVYILGAADSYDAITSARPYCTARTPQDAGRILRAEAGKQFHPAVAEISHVNVNDGTVEGLCYKRPNCFTTQFHPEANAGPKDTEYLFNRFVDSMGGDR